MTPQYRVRVESVQQTSFFLATSTSTLRTPLLALPKVRDPVLIILASILRMRFVERLRS
jgi:hypothetical protein